MCLFRVQETIQAGRDPKKQKHGLSEEIRDLYLKHEKRETNQLNLREVSSILEKEVSRFSKIYVVLDALDESSTYDDATATILAELRKLQPS
jgi:hypothetical protein